MSFIVEGADIPLFHLITLKHAIKLEQIGMKHSSGKSAVSALERLLQVKIPRTKDRRDLALALIEEILQQARGGQDDF